MPRSIEDYEITVEGIILPPGVHHIASGRSLIHARCGPLGRRAPSTLGVARRGLSGLRRSGADLSCSGSRTRAVLWLRTVWLLA